MHLLWAEELLCVIIARKVVWPDEPHSRAPISWQFTRPLWSCTVTSTSSTTPRENPWQYCVNRTQAEAITSLPCSWMRFFRDLRLLPKTSEKPILGSCERSQTDSGKIRFTFLPVIVCTDYGRDNIYRVS